MGFFSFFKRGKEAQSVKELGEWEGKIYEVLQKKDYRSAIDYCTKVIDKGVFTGNTLSKFYFQRAISYRATNRPAEAVKDFENFLRFFHEEPMKGCPRIETGTNINYVALAEEQLKALRPKSTAQVSAPGKGCDLCGAAIQGNAAIYDKATMKNAANRGLAPRGMLASLAKSQGVSQEVFIQVWKQQVVETTDSWNICPSCAKEIEKYKSGDNLTIGQTTKELNDYYNGQQYQNVIDYCTDLLGKKRFVEPVDLQVVYMYRGLAYKSIGDTKNAKNDLELCLENITMAEKKDMVVKSLLEGTRKNITKHLADL